MLTQNPRLHMRKLCTNLKAAHNTIYTLLHFSDVSHLIQGVSNHWNGIWNGTMEWKMEWQ